MSIASTLGALGQVSLALSPKIPAAKPHTVTQVGAEWLTSVLAQDTPGARVVDVEDRGGTSGTTDRRRLQLTWNDEGVEADLPTNLFVKATSPSPKNRTMVAALWMAINEVKFYTQVRPTLGDIAPRCYYARAGHGARFVLLLDDLVELGARPVLHGDEFTIDHARALVDTLAQLHAVYWRSPRLETDLSWAAPMTGRPGFSLLARQFRVTRRKFLAQADERELGPRVRRMLRLLNEHDLDLYRTWSEGPQTFVHGDSHVGNTYATADGRAGLLDWQVVFRTRGTREVSYLIVGALTRELRQAHEKELIQRYLDRLAEAGVSDPPTFEQAFDDYRFFAHDSWDSNALTMLWPGLHPPESLQAGHERVSAAIDDLAVDEIVEQRVKDGYRA
ncbi:MAG: phosphotransferase [Acidimicrobiia bacterium]|nr:phosphotransferase [Acidimicrobiia bacterium]